MKPMPEAATMWAGLHAYAEYFKKTYVPWTRGAIVKNCYTTASHVVAGHLYTCAQRYAQEHREELRALITGDQEVLEKLIQEPVDADWFNVGAAAMATGPAHLYMMAHHMTVIRNEMRLPPHLQASPPDEPPSQTRPAGEEKHCQPTGRTLRRSLTTNSACSRFCRNLAALLSSPSH